ncbi:hypothetical protein BDGGKGIB_03831 [Nodularia sphaerocarpa UHCC 0038]|nr:hypothetical protein BDGGKGIB_03831 [Nodularia sphaerocarpa UHCC 0038]
MLRDGLIKIVRRISNNTSDKTLEHRDITALAHGALQILDDIEGISMCRDEIETLLRMLTTRAPHHARSRLARELLHYLSICSSNVSYSDDSKKPQGQESF